MKPETKQILIDLIRNEFDAPQKLPEYVTNRNDNLIETAIDLGFTEFAAELINDL